MVGLALVLPVNLILMAFGDFTFPGTEAGPVTISLSIDLLGVALLGWANLRLQKPLDEGVRWGEWWGLLRDWLVVGWAFCWRAVVTCLVVSLPSLVAGFSAGFAAGTGGAAPEVLPGWLVRTEAVLVALALGGWTVVYLWVFPLVAVRQDQEWRFNFDEGLRLTRKYWYWGAVIVVQAAVWALLGPHTQAADAWYSFGTAAAGLLFQTGQVLWLLSRRP